MKYRIQGKVSFEVVTYIEAADRNEAVRLFRNENPDFGVTEVDGEEPCCECETCGEILFSGDDYTVTGDDIHLCSACTRMLLEEQQYDTPLSP